MLPSVHPLIRPPRIDPVTPPATTPNVPRHPPASEARTQVRKSLTSDTRFSKQAPTNDLRRGNGVLVCFTFLHRDSSGCFVNNWTLTITFLHLDAAFEQGCGQGCSLCVRNEWKGYRSVLGNSAIAQEGHAHFLCARNSFDSRASSSFMTFLKRLSFSFWACPYCSVTRLVWSGNDVNLCWLECSTDPDIDLLAEHCIAYPSYFYLGPFWIIVWWRTGEQDNLWGSFLKCATSKTMAFFDGMSVLKLLVIPSPSRTPWL